MKERNIQNAEFAQILPSPESNVTAAQAVSDVCGKKHCQVRGEV